MSPSSEEMDKRTTLIVQRTLTDTSRRKKNITVSGFTENALQGDCAEFVRLSEEHMSLKPLVAESGLAGRSLQDQGNCRYSLVIMNCQLLQFCRHLGNCEIRKMNTFPTIFTSTLICHLPQRSWSTKAEIDNVTG